MRFHVMTFISLFAALPAYAQMHTEFYTPEEKQKPAVQIVDNARTALAAISQQIPLSIGLSVFITAKSDGYGMYTEKQTAMFKPRERLRFYIEPQGYRFITDDKTVRFGLSLDVAILTSEGQSLYRKDDFISNDFISHRTMTEMSLTGELDLSGLEQGGYILELTLHDKFLPSARAVSRLPFRMGE